MGLRAFCDEVSATFLRLFAYVGAVTVVGIGLVKIYGTAPVEAAVDPSARSSWVTAEHPLRAYAISIPEFDEPEPDYTILRHAGRRPPRCHELGRGQQFTADD